MCERVLAGEGTTRLTFSSGPCDFSHPPPRVFSPPLLFFNFWLHRERADVEGCVDGRQVPEPRGVYEGRGMKV